MKSKTNFKIQVYLEERRFININVAKIKVHEIHSSIGFALDEIQLQSTLMSDEDIDDLIKFLTHLRPSFKEIKP